MDTLFRLAEKIPAGACFALLAEESKPLRTKLLTSREKAWVASFRVADPDKLFIPLQRTGQWIAVIFTGKGEEPGDRHESCRRSGSRLSDLVAEQRIPDVYLTTTGPGLDCLIALAEGLALASYRFLRYLSAKNAARQSHSLQSIHLVNPGANVRDLRRLHVAIKYTFYARDLVNEPPSTLNAKDFAHRIIQDASALNIRTEVFSRGKIEALKMGGLLAVNRGSVDPPSFTILEWKPEQARNKRPVVLVGKGVIFDTGGMNLKTGTLMDGMKSDMAGAALMAAALMALAEMECPLYLIALIPATDNRVDGNALLPGDVITMHNGTTVEVKNTDAEGRLILADALSYAKRYDPSLIIDAATLTGSAMRAIGHYGIVAMQHNAPLEMQQLMEAGTRVRERIVEFPMWKDYDEQLKSDIADIANVGGPNGGAIIAARFLARFTETPFIHLDIAGPAFIEKREHYIPKGATGIGLRLLVSFLQGFIPEE